MFAYQQPVTVRSNQMPDAMRPVSTRAAFGLWAVASVGGWLMLAGLLRAVGIL